MCCCACHKPSEVRLEFSGFVGSKDDLLAALKDVLSRYRGRGI